MSVEESAEKCKRYLEELVRNGFYGDLVFKFKGGEVYHIEVHRSYKPDNLPVREDNDEHSS